MLSDPGWVGGVPQGCFRLRAIAFYEVLVLRSCLKPSSAVLGHLHDRSSYRPRRGREALTITQLIAYLLTTQLVSSLHGLFALLLNILSC